MATMVGNPTGSVGEPGGIRQAAMAKAASLSGGVNAGTGRTEREMGRIEERERRESPRVKNRENLEQLRGKQKASEELARQGRASPYEQNPRNRPTRA